jgi:malonyl CoA-acyl carrier protein transacylase
MRIQPVHLQAVSRALRILGIAVLVPAALPAQQHDSTTMQQAYEQRRSELLKDLQQTQDSLGSLRSQRVRLESHIDNVLAQSTEQRAQQLLISGDLNALLQLDAVLAQAQENMTAQRDRMTALGDAVRKRSGAALVVLFRADSAPAGAATAVVLTIDNTDAATHTYSTIAQTALHQGAVDELYNAEMLPTVHTVQANATVGGQSMISALNVQTAANMVTYVQFSVKDGKVTSSTWTSQGTTP